MGPSSSVFDVVFAGGGTTACVIAGRLAAIDPSLKILVIESGEHSRDVPRHFQPSKFVEHLGPTHNTQSFYVGKPSGRLNGRGAVISCGRCVGGGSAVNALLYVRGAASDYDDWAAFGNQGWGFDRLLPFIRKLETFTPIANGSSTHGCSGPIKISAGRANLDIGNQLSNVAKEYDPDRPWVDDNNDFATPDAYSPACRFTKAEFTLDAVAEEEGEFADDDNGLAGYEDEDDSDVSFSSPGGSSIGSADEFDVEADRRSISPSKSIHQPRASLSKTWTFPRGKTATPVKNDDEVDRFFGCLEDNGGSPPLSDEISQIAFSSAFQSMCDDELPPFFIPSDIGVVVESTSRNLGVMPEEEEDAVGTGEDFHGEPVEGGIRFTFNPPPVICVTPPDLCATPPPEILVTSPEEVMTTPAVRLRATDSKPVLAPELVDDDGEDESALTLVFPPKTPPRPVGCVTPSPPSHPNNRTESPPSSIPRAVSLRSMSPKTPAVTFTPSKNTSGRSTTSTGSSPPAKKLSSIPQPATLAKFSAPTRAVIPSKQSQAAPSNANDPMSAFRCPSSTQSGGATTKVNGNHQSTSYSSRFVDPVTGRRSDAASAYLYPHTGENSNLMILVGKRVKRVIVEYVRQNAYEELIDVRDRNGRAIAVEYVADPVSSPSAGEEVTTAKAEKLIIVSAGAMGSPAILERSGIGARSILEKCNVPVLVDLPGVGENYKDHVGTYLVYYGSDETETMNDLWDNPDGYDAWSKEWEENGSGKIAHNGVEALIKVRLTKAQIESSGTELKRRWESFFQCYPDKSMGIFVPFSGYALHRSVSLTRKTLSWTYYNLYPESVGSVHITSGQDTNSSLDFDPDFLTKLGDVEQLALLYKQSRELIRRLPAYRGEVQTDHPRFPTGSSAACKEWDVPVSTNAPDIVYSEADDEAIANFHRDRATGTYHSLGTCAMKPRNQGGVVDARLNVYGILGLKVADLSICPCNVGNNTYSTALLIGEKAAAIIAEDLGYVHD